MSNVIANFQSELLQKIHQKSKSKESVDSFLVKAFKFFDLSHNGCLSKGDFFKAIAKCGVVVQPSNIETVYQHYAGQQNYIEYHHFIEQIAYRQDEIHSNSSRLKMSQKSHFQHPQNKSGFLKKQQQQVVLQESKVFKAQPDLKTYDEVLQHIKINIQANGLGSLLMLAVAFKSIDTKKTHLVNRNTLSKQLQFLSKGHITIIVSELSENGSDVDYSIFIYDLKGQLNGEIVKEIDNAFFHLDTRRQGEFPIEYMVNSFLSKSTRDKFKNAVDLYARFQGIDDGVFTQDDFNDFLGFLSFDFKSIEDFKKAIIRPFYQQDARSSISQKSNRTRDFQLNKSQKEVGSNVGGDFKKDKKKQQEGDRLKQFEQFEEAQQKKSVSRYSQFEGHEMPSNKLKVYQSVLGRIKKRLATKGTRGFLQLEKAFRNADTNNDTLLTIEQFTQVIKDQRIDITTTESNSIFDLFDNQGIGLISFVQFMFTLRGHMSQFRKEMSQKLWRQLKNNDQTTSFPKIRHLLNFRSHPDIQTGRKYEQDIWKEIQETILLIQELNGVPRSDNISKAQFQEYLQNLSLSVIDDKLFESILLNFWRLDLSSSILEKYAGSRKLFDHSKNGYLMDHHRNYVKGGSVSQNAPFGTFQQPTSYTTEHNRL